MVENYTVLHLHSDLSNGTTTIDSVTKYEDYIKKAKECNMSSIAFSEHGSVFEWWHKKCSVEKAGMKYIHASEVYVTKNLENKTRDNFHCLLICKNYEGVKELNYIISKSFNREDNHFYYSPRITYNELKKLSNNIIISTACIGGILNKGDSELQLDFLNFLSKNNDRCFLEIQHHTTKIQIDYNNKLIELSKKYNISLLACTDTHCLNEKHVSGRSILQKSKNIFFEDECGWDLTFKTYEELCASFEKQGMNKEIYLNAIKNTNKIAEMVEDFSLDKNTKYPKIYENSEKEFKEKINKAYHSNPYIKERYGFKDVQKILQEEIDVYKKTGSVDFILLQTYLREWEFKNGIQCGYGRGSVSGSLIAYLLGITQMDSLKFGLNFFRFQNPSRISNCDIDTDYHSGDRERVKDFLLNEHLNLENIQCSEIITFNTVALKGAIKDVCRALNITLDVAQSISNAVYLNENKEWEVDSIWRERYPEVFEYADIVNGTIVSIGSHPSGVLVTDEDINENICTCTLATSKYPVSMLNMKELDDLMYVKLDILGLDNLGVINETCKMLEIERLTPDNVNLEDEDVWSSIRDDTTLIFQWESDSAQAYLKKLLSDETINKVKNTVKSFSYIKWFSFGNGLIRPACASYRDDVANGNFYNNHFKELDEFLAPTLGRVTMQEDIMQFLVKFCGYSQAESDNVRRGIAKKYGTEKLLPEIEKRFIEYSSAHYNITKEECAEIIKPFLETILQASLYAFSWNHSDSYSCIGYICGYLRYYYPLEFLTVSLNIFKDKEDKTMSISKYANKINIKINNPRFRYSKSDYMMDKITNSIYKGLSSIKHINDKCGEELYNLKNNQYSTFIDLLYELKDLSINSRQLDILIYIGFFEEFGDINNLLFQVEIFNLFQKSKTIKVDKWNDLGYNEDIIIQCSEKQTEKTYSGIDNKKLINLIIQSTQIPTTTILDKIKYQIKYLGYTNLTDDTISTDLCVVVDTEQNNWGSTFANLYRIYDGFSKQFRANKKNYGTKCPQLERGDIIRCSFESKQKQKMIGQDENGKNQYQKLNEWFMELKAWCKV